MHVFVTGIFEYLWIVFQYNNLFENNDNNLKSIIQRIAIKKTPLVGESKYRSEWRTRNKPSKVIYESIIFVH